MNDDQCLRPKRAGYLATVFFILSPLAPLTTVHAKLNNPWVTAESDTLYLNQKEMKEFKIAKSVGEDLSNTGLLLTLAAIPSLFLARYWADGGNTAGHFNRINLVEDVFWGGVFPLCGLIMATGNIEYKKAAQKDDFVENSLTTSWLPYVVSAASLISFAFLANHILLTDCYHASQPDEYAGQCNESPSSLIGVSTLITIPWMRYQFRQSRLHLDGLEIRPGPESQKVSLTIRF